MFRLTRADLGLVAVSVIWAANYSVTKQALRFVSPASFAAMRFVLSSLLLLAIVRALGPLKASPIARRRLIGLGVIGHTLNQLAFVGGLKYTTATNSALIFASLPVAVAVFGAWLGHERPGLRMWTAIVAGAIGVAIIVSARGVGFSSDTLRGDLLTMLAVLVWAAFTVGVRWAAHDVGALEVTLLTHLGGTPGLVLAALPTAGGLGTAIQLPAVFGALLYSSIASSVIAAVLWTRGLKTLGGNRTALYSCITPVFAGAIAWVLLGERPLPTQAAGAVLVIAAVLLGTERRAPSQAA